LSRDGGFSLTNQPIAARFSVSFLTGKDSSLITQDDVFGLVIVSSKDAL
jgi:hypothetical protein